MDPRPSNDTANAGLRVVGMLMGAFALVASACIVAVTLSGPSDPAGSPTPAGPGAVRAGRR